MFNSYYLGLFIHVGMGRLGSRWQVLFLVVNAVDDEDELEAFAYCFLTICTGCSAVCLILWVLCSEAWCIDYSDDCIKLLWVYMMRFCSLELHYIYFSIVFYPCAVSFTIESAMFILPLTVTYGCLAHFPRTIPLFPCGSHGRSSYNLTKPINIWV